MVTARSYPSYPDQTCQYTTSSSRASNNRFFDLPFGHSTGDHPDDSVGLTQTSSEVIDKPMDPILVNFETPIWVCLKMLGIFPMK